jgi:hypothetical protein
MTDKTARNKKKQRVLAWPPRGYHWVEDFDSIDKLNTIYSKLMAIASYFSRLQDATVSTPIETSNIYGFWFILEDICDDLADIIKLDHWTGTNSDKADEGEEK